MTFWKAACWLPTPQGGHPVSLPLEAGTPRWDGFLQAKLLGWNSESLFPFLSAIRFLTQNQINLSMLGSLTPLPGILRKGKPKQDPDKELAGTAEPVKSTVCREHACSTDSTWAWPLSLLYFKPLRGLKFGGAERDPRMVCWLWCCARHWLRHLHVYSDAAILNGALK